MYRNTLLIIAALSLSVSGSGRAQSSSERAQEQRDRDRERAAERADRAREKEAERREREKATSLDTVVAFDARGIVSVSCPGGAVIVTGSDKNEIRVKAHTESGPIRFSASATRATLEPSTGRGCSDGRFEVTVPVGTRLTAITWSGEARVRGVHGDVDVHSHSGDIEVRDAERLDIDALSGDLVLSGVKGDLSVHTVSGGLELTGSRGAVVIETISGDVELKDVVSNSVRVHNSSGDISFDGAIQDAGRYEFSTHSGEIFLNLPVDIGAELSLSTFNGGIDSDFPITLKAGEHGIGSSQAKKLNFTVGHGTARIIAETFSGDINLRRRGRTGGKD